VQVPKETAIAKEIKMKLGVLLSSGKDSILAMHRAAEKNEISCLITLVSENKESYMFHTPNISLAKEQAKCMEIPIIVEKTKGIKEKELADLERALKKAKEKYKISGISTGALASNYQASRIRNICEKLNLKCLNPLWEMDQIELLKDIVKENFDVIIVGVFAYPFTKKWLGKKIDYKVIEELAKLEEKYQINPAGEGGEIETFVLDAPMFKKKIKIIDFDKEYSNYSGVMKIKKIQILDK